MAYLKKMQYTINLCVNLSRIDYYMLAGGSAGNTELSSVYYLADGGSDWVTIQPMTVPRKYPACALVGDHLYVVGGTGKSSVEVLDILTLTWQTGHSLTDCTSCDKGQAVSYQGLLYYVSQRGLVLVYGSSGWSTVTNVGNTGHRHAFPAVLFTRDIIY